MLLAVIPPLLMLMLPAVLQFLLEFIIFKKPPVVSIVMGVTQIVLFKNLRQFEFVAVVMIFKPFVVVQSIIFVWLLLLVLLMLLLLLFVLLLSVMEFAADVVELAATVDKRSTVLIGVCIVTTGPDVCRTLEAAVIAVVVVIVSD